MFRYGLSDTLKLLRLYTALVLPNGPILAHSMVLPQVPVSVCTEAKGEVAPNPKQDTAGQWWATSLQVGDPAVPCSPIAGSCHVDDSHRMGLCRHCFSAGGGAYNWVTCHRHPVGPGTWPGPPVPNPTRRC